MNSQEHENLLTYLNDHWAGSVAAVSLIDDLIALDAIPDFSAALGTLRAEIKNDQLMLKSIILKLDERVDTVKSVTAWFAEKWTRLKLELQHARLGALGAFEALEMLALGIEGKRLLWMALDEYGLQDKLRLNLDFTCLIRAAHDQGLRVQQWRLVVGRAAFSTQ